MAHESERTQTGRAAAWLAGDRILRTILGFTVGIAVARHLGPGGFGILAWCLATVAVVSPLTTLGLEMIITRRCIQAPGTIRNTVMTALGLRLAGSLVAACAVAALCLAGPPRPSEAYLAMALIAATLPLSACDTIDAAMQARLRIARPTALRFAAFSVSCVIRLTLVCVDADLISFAAAMLAEAALAAGLVCLLCNRELTGSAPVAARPLLAEAAPLLGTDLIIAAYMRADQLILEWWDGLAALGVYAVAQRLADAWIMMPNAYATAAFPRMVDHAADSTGPMSPPVFDALRRIVWLSLACAALTSGTAWLIIPFIFGDVFKEAIVPATILPWAGFFAMMGVARGKWLIAAGLQRFSLAFIGIGGILGLCLLAVLIPRYGMLGAAIAAVATQASIALLVPLLFRRTRPTVAALLAALARPPGWRGW